MNTINLAIRYVRIQPSMTLVLLLLLSVSIFNNLQAAGNFKSGKQVYDVSCAGCHATGVLEAPKFGSKKDWEKREKQGLKILIKHALTGFNNMPAKGGNPAIKNEEINAAVSYMLSQSGFEKYAEKENKTKSVKKSKKNDQARAVNRKPITKSRTVNRFNRLMKSSAEWNLPPSKDGIHDPENEGTEVLQPPKAAFDGLPKAKSGNRIDWVKALEDGSINPRYDRLDPDAAPVVMDLNIVREVKGSMPNVVYPHKQHTEWLDCSNCHPGIFIPQKGANQISMASILLGQKCGVCHGKVAFPVSECRKCHSQSKK